MPALEETPSTIASEFVDVGGVVQCGSPSKEVGPEQTLRGLKFIIFIFIFSRSIPKTQSAHEWDL